MGRALKVLLWAVVALVLIAVLGGYLLSPKFTVVRTVQIQAPPDRVYALVASPRAWKEWSVWNRRDPSMMMGYSGADSGAGAVWTWQSKSEGDGRMTFTAAEPNRHVAFELFFPDFGTTSTGGFDFVPEAGGTKVSWTMNGDLGRNPVFRWMGLFADKMVGKDFEMGLANLKELAEKG
jgi:uncharacterized protein YndB with AHSA1/START domain